MKQIKFFAMALAALTMFSCSKDEANGGANPPVVEGVETYATFNFQVEGNAPKSRAASGTDKDVTAEEAAVKDIRILIFDNQKKLEVDAIVEVTAGTLVNKAVKATSGIKTIYIFANSKSISDDNKFPTLTVGTTTLEEFYNMGEKMPSAFSYMDLVDNATHTLGYFMSNIRGANSVKTLRPNISASDSEGAGGEAVNHFTFVVQRAISKVKAKLKDATVATSVEGGALTDLNFTVRNINKGSHPVQLFANELIEDITVGGSGKVGADLRTEMPIAPFFNFYNGKSDAFMENINNFTNYLRTNAIDQPLTENDATNAVFVTENTNARIVKGNTSYLAVSGVYTPAKVVTTCTYDSGINDGTFAITADEAGVAGADFYKIDFTGLAHLGNTPDAKLKNHLFKELATARALVKSVLVANNIANPTDEQANAHISKYTGGVTYYRLNIADTDAEPKVIGIKRNRIYNITINKIAKLGDNEEGDLDTTPEVPIVSQETFVTATISVAAWKNVNQGGEL